MARQSVVRLKTGKTRRWTSPPNAPLKVLTPEEQRDILQATREHVGGARDHTMFSLALLAGLRGQSIVALDVGNVRESRGRLRGWLELRPEQAKGQHGYAARLPRVLRERIADYIRLREREEGRKLADEDALFVSRGGGGRKGRRHAEGGGTGARGTTGGGRLSVRSLRRAWIEWQKRLGIDPPYPFHSCRHTYGTRVQRLGKDAMSTAALLGHANLRSTQRYLHASRTDLAELVKELGE